MQFEQRQLGPVGAGAGRGTSELGDETAEGDQVQGATHAQAQGVDEDFDLKKKLKINLNNKKFF